MKRQWTSKQRALLAQQIQQWKPWTRSTGPKSAKGKAIVARNGFKGGTRPAMRMTVQALKLALAEQISYLHGLEL